jgi:hypothetical protein
MRLLLPSPRGRYCNGCTRRDFLAAGSIPFLGLSMAHLLEARAAAAATAARPAADSLIVIWLGGGASQLETFDPKPQAPAETRGHFGSIPTTLPGIRFCDRLPRLAATLDRFCVVRSVTHPDRNHGTADHLMLSGYLQSPATAYPAIGSVLGKVLGYRGAMPPAVAIPSSPLGAGYLGSAWSAFRVGGDPNSPAFTVRDLQPPVDVNTARLRRRGDLLRLVDDGVRAFEQADGPRSLSEFYQRANTIVTSPEAREAFDLGKEPESLRNRYGRTTLGQSALLARRLVERGVRMVTVSQGGWDHHANIFSQLDEGMLASVDQVTTSLLGDLHDRGLLERTLVMLTGEFGRTPGVNYAVGRDHWPDAFSVLLAGGGIRGGVVYGETDARAAYPTADPCTPADLLATFYRQLGLDPETELHTPDGRPIKVLAEGQVVSGILG